MAKFSFVCGLVGVQCSKRFLIFSLLATVSSVLLSCSNQASHDSMAQALASLSMAKKQTTRRATSWVLSPETRISLAQAAPQKEIDTGHLARTHHTLNQILYKEFVRFFPHTNSLADGSEHVFLTAKQKAFQGESELLVVPTLLLSEDKTNGTGETRRQVNLLPNKAISPNKLVLQLSIYESYSSRLIENVTIEGAGGRMSYRSVNPASMLAPAIRQYLETITGERVLSSR